MKSLSILVSEVKYDMDMAKIPYDRTIPVVKNSRLRSVAGKCKYKMNLSGNWVADIIEINGKMLSNESESFLKNVICHELIHSSCVGDGHKGKWSKYAKLMNKRNSNYHITRCYTRSEVSCSYRAKSEYKYRVVCLDCGKEYYYKRKTRTVQDIENGVYGYSCGKCGNENLIVELIGGC